MKSKVKRVLASAILVASLFANAFAPVQVSAASKSIPKSAVTYNGHKYMIFNNKSSWESAQKYCKSKGGYLAIIDNAKENKFLYNYMKKQGYNSAYFGLTDKEEEGVWKTSKGKKAKYTNWRNGEPNNERGKEHYAMFYWKNTDGTWNDGDFGNGTVSGGTAYICEWDTSTPKTPSITSIKKKTGTISGKTSKNVTVYIKIGNKTYKGKSDANGKFKIVTAKIKNGTEIKVYAKNKYNLKSKTKTVVVY